MDETKVKVVFIYTSDKGEIRVVTNYITKEDRVKIKDIILGDE